MADPLTIEVTLTEAGAEALNLAGIPDGAQLPDGLPAGLEIVHTVSLPVMASPSGFPSSFTRSRREETLEVRFLP